MSDKVVCVCDKVVCVKRLCVCVRRLCVRQLYVTKLYVTYTYVRTRSGGGGARGADLKQEPHTILWGKIPQPDPSFVKKSWGSGFPRFFSFKLQNTPGVPSPFLSLLAPIQASHSPKWPKSDAPPRLASLYTCTQPRPSAGFRNQ